MPGTATQLYPTAQPRVNGYRSILADAGCTEAGLLIGEERLAWAWQERVDCTSAWFPGRLLSRLSRKQFILLCRPKLQVTLLWPLRVRASGQGRF